MTTTLIAIVLIIAIVSFFYYSAKASLSKTASTPTHQNILQLTDENINREMHDKIVLVDFWAAWCAPCRMMNPILNELVDEISTNCRIGKVNIEEHPTLAQRFNVRSIPTMIIFMDGKEVHRMVGIRSKDQILKAIDKI